MATDKLIPAYISVMARYGNPVDDKEIHQYTLGMLECSR